MSDRTEAGLTPEQMTEAIASLSTDDHIDSPFGFLELFDGVPTPDTVKTVYDALDLMRGIDVFLNAVPGASLVAFRNGMRSVGVDSPRAIGYTDPRGNSEALFLTANTETTYGMTMLDLRAWGPTVIEAPPESLCVVDDFWFRYVADMGIAGPDGGEGGKYLFLPPGYDEAVPDGYYVCRTPTFSNFVVLRALGGVPAMKQTRIYPLSEADDPAENEWVNLAELAFNTIHANDFSFYEEIDALVQEEPIEALDPERRGQLAAIGIVKGQSFAPDDRMRAILERAAPIAAAMARAIAYSPRDSGAEIYGSWKNAFVGGSHEFLSDGARQLDARTQFHYLATVITPAMAHAQVGTGSAYAYTIHDATGEVLDGGRSYRLRIDPDPPAKNFWAVDVYDTQTRSLLQVESTKWPALASNTETLEQNPDGSFDLYFGPQPPDGKQSNWVETRPGKSWFPILRLYGPLESWFDQTWRLNEFERIG